ncbi:hypothetical protein PtA15_2A271 [Puccinia triticina]|uniref:Uncharacterized protein n=1 Tax=Puccinia triticina TaxID=208348 RepID=A0ABY7CC49_9BASI|nr:uncharacterized protein PtA15_2A271 [Puccinia triticina]WAQ81958.1 hypothetical protein PtA15_2A271 [Puccinia triticina]WAR52842.1 hypothetical protein PtB15_2B270 [Puccinia triticina]
MSPANQQRPIVYLLSATNLPSAPPGATEDGPDHHGLDIKILFLPHLIATNHPCLHQPAADDLGRAERAG